MGVTKCPTQVCTIPKASPTILTHQVVEYRVNLTKGTLTLLKPTLYPDPHALAQRSLLRLELLHWNCEGLRELPFHDLLRKIFKNDASETFCKDIT
jgi:hypothetical protein